MSSAHATAFADTTDRVARGSIWAGRLCGFWLGLFPILDFALRPALTRNAAMFDQVRYATPALAFALVSTALAAAIPGVWAALANGVDFRRAKYLALAAFLLCLSIPLSYLSQSDLQDALYVILVYNAFGAAILLTSANLDRDLMLRNLFTTLAIMHAVIMGVVLIDHDFAWGRLFGRNAPAYWGIVAQTTLISCIAMRGWWLRGALLILAVAILFFTQTRGSMMAVAAGLSIVFLIFSLTSNNARIWLWLAVALVTTLVIVGGANFIADDLLKLSDPNRGVTSGLTGRANVWRESLDLFTSHPWVGVGYRQHEQYLTSEATAHNAYLATLADTGIIGFTGYMVFIIGGAARAIQKALANPRGPELASAAFLVAFIFNGLVERSALNTGNAYCQLMIVVAAWAWRQDIRATTPDGPSFDPSRGAARI